MRDLLNVVIVLGMPVLALWIILRPSRVKNRQDVGGYAGTVTENATPPPTKRAAYKIFIRIIIAFLFMVLSLWNLSGFLKDVFQNSWLGNFNNPVPPLSWPWIVLGLVGVVIFIQAGVSWDRIQDAEASNQRE